MLIEETGFTYSLSNEYISFSDDKEDYLTITDEQDSVRLVLDKDGKVLKTYQYDAFGCSLNNGL